MDLGVEVEGGVDFFGEFAGALEEAAVEEDRIGTLRGVDEDLVEGTGDGLGGAVEMDLHERLRRKVKG